MFSATAILNMLKKHDIEGIKQACIMQIRIEESEKIGKKPTAKTRITALKNCLSTDENRIKLTKSHIEEGKQTICNGLLGIALNEIVPEIVLDTESEGVLIVKMIQEGKGSGQQEIATEIKNIVADTIADFKVAYKQDRNTKVIPAIVERNCKIGFNPQYMHDVIIGLGGYESCSVTWPEKATSPIHIESDLGVAIVLPIRIKE